jgi:hypothetical protein
MSSDKQGAASPLPLAGEVAAEAAGEGGVGKCENARRHPHPALRATFSRQREKGIQQRPRHMNKLRRPAIPLGAMPRSIGSSALDGGIGFDCKSITRYYFGPFSRLSR